MTAKVFIGGTWRTITSGKIYLGGAWRTITRGQVYKGGAWKDGPAFVPALAASAIPDNTSGSYASRHPVLVTSGFITATPIGGLGPYTYSWDGAGSTPSNPTNATTAFSRIVGPFDTFEVTVSCVVTDSLGSTAAATALVFLFNEGE